jgi:hemin uptake protein HemP
MVERHAPPPSNPSMTPPRSPAQPPSFGTGPTADAASTAIAAGGGAVSSSTLLGGRQELLIQHRGEHYRLRVTRLGKLILTK